MVPQRLFSVAIVMSHDMLVQIHCDGASLHWELSGTQGSHTKELQGSFYPFLCLWAGHGHAIQVEKNLFNLKSPQKCHNFFGQPSPYLMRKTCMKSDQFGIFSILLISIILKSMRDYRLIGRGNS